MQSIYIFKHRHRQTHTHTHTHVRTRTYAHTNTHIRTHAHTHARTHTHTHTYTRTYTHTNTHTHTHTHVHTHTNTTHTSFHTNRRKKLQQTSKHFFFNLDSGSEKNHPTTKSFTESSSTEDKQLNKQRQRPKVPRFRCPIAASWEFGVGRGGAGRGGVTGGREWGWGWGWNGAAINDPDQICVIGVVPYHRLITWWLSCAGAAIST